MASSQGPEAIQQQKLEFSEPLKMSRTRTVPANNNTQSKPALSEKEQQKRDAITKKEKTLDIVSKQTESPALFGHIVPMRD